MEGRKREKGGGRKREKGGGNGLLSFVYDFLFTQKYYWQFCGLLLVAELVLCVVIVRFVPYTEIDWEAYMQEVAGPIEHDDYNYENLEGGTGPLVYPAGFVYIYSLLYHLTDKGENILLAQYIFSGIYVIFIAFLMDIYHKAKAPPVLLLLVSLSRRCHSIFVLRLFNDGIAMLLLYASISLFIRHRYLIGCVFYSLAVSVKMNILLFAPALWLVLIHTYGFFLSAIPLFICAAVQVILSIPFIMVNLKGYLIRSFNLSRVFQHTWTVNFKFLPEDLFVSKQLAISLLAIHISLLIYFIIYKWKLPPYSSSSSKNQKTKKSSPASLSPSFIIMAMFTCNLIGVFCCRSLHFQFYSWYYHQLPLVMYFMRDVLPMWLWVLVLVGIEVVWNIFPSNFYSSLCLQGLHFVLLGGMLLSSKIIPKPVTN